MSIKRFCDVCGLDMTHEPSGRVTAKTGRVRLEVHSSVDGVWNGGDLCQTCILKIVAQGKKTRES